MRGSARTSAIERVARVCTMSPTSQAVEGRSRAERLRLTGPCGRPHDDLVVLEHAHGGAVGLDELGGHPRALIEDRVRVELPCQLASRASELLRE